MRVHIRELKEGCILTEDVVGKTKRPIIPSKTILTNELIQFLRVFMIKDVKVQSTLVNGMPFTPQEVIEEEIEDRNVPLENETHFTEMFLQATREFKKEFLSWQSGIPLDIPAVRGILLPLLERLNGNIREIFSLHHFSTDKEYVFQHSVAVALLSAFIGNKLGYNKGDIVQLAIAGCLSDCGMAKLPPHLLNKNGALTSYEFEEIKNHPAYSYNMIQNNQFLKDAAKISIFQHHERLDGSGYPKGEKGDKIHPFAKVIAVADVFHAMTSSRHYRKKQSAFKVLEMMIQDSFGKFDIRALKALQTGLMNFSIGSHIKLSNGQLAEILFIEDNSPTRPLIKLLETDEILHLVKNRDIHIEEVLS